MTLGTLLGRENPECLGIDGTSILRLRDHRWESDPTEFHGIL
jgi:hypothetical protein